MAETIFERLKIIQDQTNDLATTVTNIGVASEAIDLMRDCVASRTRRMSDQEGVNQELLIQNLSGMVRFAEFVQNGGKIEDLLNEIASDHSGVDIRNICLGQNVSPALYEWARGRELGF
jgi:hypothetical protein